jgi:hypothetical protein
MCQTSPSSSFTNDTLQALLTKQQAMYCSQPRLHQLPCLPWSCGLCSKPLTTAQQHNSTTAQAANIWSCSCCYLELFMGQTCLLPLPYGVIAGSGRAVSAAPSLHPAFHHIPSSMQADFTTAGLTAVSHFTRYVHHASCQAPCRARSSCRCQPLEGLAWRSWCPATWPDLL